MATFSYPELQEIEKFASEIIDNKMPNDTKLYKVRSFEEMVKLVAHLRFCNQEYLLLYRGQRELYKNQNDDYSFYPSIFRPTGKYKSLQPGELKTRFKFLEKVREILRNKLPQSYLKAFEEKEDAILYSIIQHYNLAPTPVLDLTHSLQVAYSFATLENPEECNIAIFAFPHLQGTRIFYKTKPSITNVPLQYHCPPEALRTHFQEAYSIGLK